MRFLFGNRKRQEPITQVVYSKEQNINTIDPVVEVVSKPTEQELILAMYNEFDETPKRLLKEAFALLDKGFTTPLDETQKSIADRHRALGFNSTKTVRTVEPLERDRSSEIRSREMIKETADNVIYYQANYRFLKFITVEELTRICTKYGLITAPVNAYIGDIPEKNLIEIENGQPIKIKDLASGAIKQTSFWDDDEGGSSSAYDFPFEEYLTKDVVTTNSKDINWGDSTDIDGFIDHLNSYSTPQYDHVDFRSANVGFHIAAPLKMFDPNKLSLLHKVGSQYIEVIKTDPVVFKYCRGGVLIYSKWGLEASDPGLSNPIEN